MDIGRGKLVGSQGPGSLYIDTEGSSFIISSVDKWYDGINVDMEKFKISDKRLETILRVKSFYEVPEFRKTSKKGRRVNTLLKIPVNRFPLLEYCSVCHTLGNAKKLDHGKSRRCTNCNKTTIHIQFPIIIICENGHVQDFPYKRYIHGRNYSDNCNGTRQYIETNDSRSILNWSLKCNCGQTRSLSGVTGKSSDGSTSPFVREMEGTKCFGKRPWTGNSVDDDCNEVPVAVLKNSLNVYRPELVRSLSISDSGQFIGTPTLQQILTEEYKALSEGNNEDEDKLKVRKSFGLDKSIIKKISYVDRLQELVVQTNFHRIEPSDEENSYTNAVNQQARDSMIFSEVFKSSWYPAKKMFGEGIFIQFNSEILRQWENDELVSRRFSNIKLRTEEFYLSSRFETAASIMIHTLSHALIKELSKHCGYPATSINEKLYLQVEGEYGLLLYVTDSDKSGTFGGLVRLAERSKFKKILYTAIRNLEWCSSDPVCYEFGANNGQGLENSNGSSCHNCSYVPDITCSFRNCFLDRDLLSRTGSNTSITSKFDWFCPNKVKITKRGMEISKDYKSWSEFPEDSNYYHENFVRLADLYDSKIEVDCIPLEAKYIWEKEKIIVLFNEQDVPNYILEDDLGWTIILEK